MANKDSQRNEVDCIDASVEQVLIYRSRKDERQSLTLRKLNLERKGIQNTAKHPARNASDNARSSPFLIECLAGKLNNQLYCDLAISGKMYLTVGRQSNSFISFMIIQGLANNR